MDDLAIGGYGTRSSLCEPRCITQSGEPFTPSVGLDLLGTAHSVTMVINRGPGISRRGSKHSGAWATCRPGTAVYLSGCVPQQKAHLFLLWPSAL